MYIVTKIGPELNVKRQHSVVVQITMSLPQEVVTPTLQW